MTTLTFVTNVIKYFMQDMFDPSTFIEVSEQCFDDCVVRFRDQYKREYESPNVQVFTDLSSGLQFKRVVTFKPCSREVVIE